MIPTELSVGIIISHNSDLFNIKLYRNVHFYQAFWGSGLSLMAVFHLPVLKRR